MEPSGWVFEYNNKWNPDVDDTAVVLMYLGGYTHIEGVQASMKKGVEWVLGMQCSDGGWGA